MNASKMRHFKYYEYQFLENSVPLVTKIILLLLLFLYVCFTVFSYHGWHSFKSNSQVRLEYQFPNFPIDVLTFFLELADYSNSKIKLYIYTKSH